MYYEAGQEGRQICTTKICWPSSHNVRLYLSNCVLDYNYVYLYLCIVYVLLLCIYVHNPVLICVS